MHFLQAINSDISVLIVCNKTGGTIKGDIKKTSSGMLRDRVKCRGDWPEMISKSTRELGFFSSLVLCSIYR